MSENLERAHYRETEREENNKNLKGCGINKE